MLWVTRTAPRLSWCWELHPLGARQTRLVTRVRFRHPWLSSQIFGALLADVRDGFIVRHAMLDVKASAEAALGKAPPAP